MKKFIVVVISKKATFYNFWRNYVGSCLLCCVGRPMTIEVTIIGSTHTQNFNLAAVFHFYPRVKNRLVVEFIEYLNSKNPTPKIRPYLEFKNRK